MVAVVFSCMCVPLFAEQDDAEKNAAEESSHRHADDDSQKQTCHTRRHSKVSEWPCTTAHGARFHVHADCTVDMILLNLPKEPIFRADILGGVLLISLIGTVTLTETMNFIQVITYWCVDLPTAYITASHGPDNVCVYVDRLYFVIHVYRNWTIHILVCYIEKDE